MRLLLVGLIAALVAAGVAEAGDNKRRGGRKGGYDVKNDPLYKQCLKREDHGTKVCEDLVLQERFNRSLGVGQQHRPDRGYFRQEVPVDRCTAEYGPPQYGFYWQFSIETDDWGDPENVCTEIPLGEHQW